MTCLAICLQALFGSIDEGMELVVDLLAGICEVVQDGEHTAAHQDLFRQVQAALRCVFSLFMVQHGKPTAAHQDLFRQSKAETGFLDCKGGCIGTGSTPCLLDLLTA